MAIPTSACASAGASLTPSPAIATTAPAACSSRTIARLVLRQHLGADLVDPEPPRHRPRRPLAVARRHHDAKPQPVQRLERRRRRLLHRVGDADEPRHRPVHHHEHHRLAPVAPRVRRRRPVARQPEVRQQRRIAERHRPALHHALHPLAGHRLEVARLGRARRPRASAPRTIASASGCSEPRSRLAASRSTSASSLPRLRQHRHQRGLAHGQRAGLVHDQRVDPREASPAPRRRGSAPRPARPRPVAVITDIGVASPSAQGQAMISTAIAETSP